jgi:hypothetical protein
MIQEQIIDKLLKDYHSSLDEMIAEAFLEHFGFPLQDVQDKEGLEHIIVEGEPLESFRYRGETFLYWYKEYPNFSDNSYTTDVKFTVKFKKV